jgi:hypothetical protein
VVSGEWLPKNNLTFTRHHGTIEITAESIKVTDDHFTKVFSSKGMTQMDRVYDIEKKGWYLERRGMISQVFKTLREAMLALKQSQIIWKGKN